jgi:putative (di)nucleoside polyphosphate hydrolase
MSQWFRVGVGMVILNDDGDVLALERSDWPGSWQLPQGGLERDEEPDSALWRELEEETGLTRDDARLVAVVPEWLGYELPDDLRNAKTDRGQVHQWSVLRLRRSAEPRLHREEVPEFAAWRWMRLEDLAETVISFRRPAYRRLAEFVEQLDA